MRRPSRRSFSARASDASRDPDPTTERTRRGFLGRTAALGTAIGLGGLAAGTVAGQEAPVTVSLTLDEEEIQVGETTDAEVRLSHVPGQGGEYEGIVGATVDLSLEEGVASFTGEHQTDAGWGQTGLDLEADDGDHTATLTANQISSAIPPGAEDVHLADVTIEAVGTGETEVGLEVQSLVDANDREFPGEAETTTLRVTEGDRPDSDGGDSSDGQPGFGVVATISAILAGAGARAAASSSVEDDGDR